MKTKRHIFLLSITFLIFFFSSTVSFADDLHDAAEAARNKEYEKAYKLLLPLAQQGYSNAQYNLSTLYSNGEGVARDFKEAIKWLRLAAEQGHAQAQNGLGLKYMQGLGVPVDFDEAIKWFRLAEENGFAKAGFWIEIIRKAQKNKTNTSEVLKAIVNELIRDGQDAAQRGDFKTAHKIFLKYAKLGFSKAQYFLGGMYLNGDGVAENIKEATKWLKLAGEQGVAIAQYALGHIYNKGEKVPQDYKEAVKWLRLAAEQGYLDAQFNLGLMYAQGQGVPQNHALAHMWWNICGSNGSKDCVKNRTIVEAEMTPQQIEKAQELFESFLKEKDQEKSGSAAKVTSNDLQDAIDAYKRKDYKEAHRLLLPLAEQGDATAQFNLGLMYQKGQGVPQDYKEAVNWWRLAAEQGLTQAQTNLGLMYSDGRGVQKNEKEAIRWLRLSAEQGNAVGQFNLGSQYFTGQGVPRDYKEAVKWYRLAAEQGHAQAQTNLGWLYGTGRGVQKNEKEAEKWFRLAAEQGNKEAQKYLKLLLQNKPKKKSIVDVNCIATEKEASKDQSQHQFLTSVIQNSENLTLNNCVLENEINAIKATLKIGSPFTFLLRIKDKNSKIYVAISRSYELTSLLRKSIGKKKDVPGDRNLIFSKFRGMAFDDLSKPMVIFDRISKGGFYYLTRDRRTPVSAIEDSITYESPDSATPIDYYAALWKDENKDKMIDKEEINFIILNFIPKAND